MNGSGPRWRSGTSRTSRHGRKGRLLKRLCGSGTPTVGWATVLPLLVKHGWEYRCCNLWDKGMSHVAGNANTQTLRKFPVVTEVCVHYVKAANFRVGDR